jgi:hypothetical protein
VTDKIADTLVTDKHAVSEPGAKFKVPVWVAASAGREGIVRRMWKGKTIQDAKRQIQKGNEGRHKITHKRQSERYGKAQHALTDCNCRTTITMIKRENMFLQASASAPTHSPSADGGRVGQTDDNTLTGLQMPYTRLLLDAVTLSNLESLANALQSTCLDPAGSPQFFSQLDERGMLRTAAPCPAFLP